MLGSRVRFFLLTVLLSGKVFADRSLNMPIGVTDVSTRVYDLHMLIFWICVVIGVLVFGAMFWAIIFHRKSVGHKAANFHESLKVEIIWTVIPIIILCLMAIPATKTMIFMTNTDDSYMTIKVTGYTWYWEYEYLGKDISYTSMLSTTADQINNRDQKSENYLLEVDKHLVLPVGKKIRILTTSNDVIHSWWVPDFAVKKDAIPGFINETWTKINTEGTYRGNCAELCGVRHGYMPIVVDAVSLEEFDKWVLEQQQSKSDSHGN